MKWIIVAFDHPNKSKSILYKQNITLATLLKAVEEAAMSGANIMSIRGFEND